MIEKELREIKRRFRPERSNIPKIVGCFVNGSGQIVSKISQSLGLADESVVEKLLNVMKKTLSGSLGTNLTDVRFSTRDVETSEKHKLLMDIRKSELCDEELLDKFYSSVTESVKFEGNYVILLARDVYDVPSRYSDDGAGESSTQFTYIVCAVCPMKDTPDVLSFREADSLFHSTAAISYLSAPSYGFMFPAFDDRCANIYAALLYSRSLTESAAAFTGAVFGSEAPMPPKAQKETFSDILASTLSEECSFDVVRSVHEQVAEMVNAHKESHDPEPLVITKTTLRTMLECCGVGDEVCERVGDAFDEGFGKNAALAPKNIISHNKFDLKMPEVSIKVSPDYRDIVSTQTVNGERYVMIRVTGGVEVNGINISFDDEKENQG